MVHIVLEILFLSNQFAWQNSGDLDGMHYSGHIWHLVGGQVKTLLVAMKNVHNVK